VLKQSGSVVSGSREAYSKCGVYTSKDLVSVISGKKQIWSVSNLRIMMVDYTFEDVLQETVLS
jgi:hypothetical protein